MLRKLRSRRERTGEGGFSTLEVIVALTILSVGLVPLVQIQLDMQQATRRLEREAAINTAVMNAVDHMRLVNPHLEPTGSRNMGTAQLSWQASLLARDTRFNQFIGQQTRDVGLYRTRVSVTLAGESQPVYASDWKQVGWSTLSDN